MAVIQKALQYKQIDFLRLFRLCKELNIVNRKRKMPTQYDIFNQSSLALSRLFKSFITKLFSEYNVKINNRYNDYVVEIPGNILNSLNFIRNNSQHILSQPGGVEIVNMLDSLDHDDDGFIYGIYNITYGSLDIKLTPSINSRRQLNSIDLMNENIISRPKEEYYRCAKSCLKYKEKWDRCIEVICEYVDNNEHSICEALEKERNLATKIRAGRLRQDQISIEEARRRRAEEVAEQRRIQEEQTLRNEEHRQLLREQLEERTRSQVVRLRNENRSRAQQLFDEALSNRRSA